MATKNTKIHKKEEEEENQGKSRQRRFPLLVPPSSHPFCNFLCFLWPLPSSSSPLVVL
jgi:hypothetical protein